MLKKRVLISGGAGFIGSHTADELYRRGYKIRILDNLSPGVHFGKWPDYLKQGCEKIRGDVRNGGDWERALVNIDYVVHLAALTDLIPDYKNFFDINVTGTALLYQVIRERKLPVKKVVVASSQFVYGEGKWRCKKHGVVTPEARSEERLKRGQWEPVCPLGGEKIEYLKYVEIHQDPPNHYAITKYAAEMIALKLGRINNIPSVAMRYSVVQGPRQSVKNMYSGAVRIFALGALAGEAPIIYEDGKQMRDFVSVYDVARANVIALEDKRADYENFNVGGGEGRTVLQLAKAVCEATKLEVDLKPSGMYRVGDVRHCISGISKLKKLGWNPRVAMEESVEEYVVWLKKQNLDRDYLGMAKKKMKELGMVRRVG
ncbi:NAD-dependent epimerase/dehydratase family protein [Candidatus Amesbacteria bacterium]|nr:NAD-dependent epimerase/dehydratase family protein [Candidatus Amesbacteria bacterium]